MKRELSLSQRIEAARNSVKGNGYNSLYLLSIFCGLLCSIPLAYILFHGHFEWLFNATRWKIASAFGFDQMPFLQKIGWAPDKLEMRFSKLFFEEYSISIWSIVAVQFAGSAVSLFYVSGRKLGKKNYIQLRSGERDAVTVKELSNEIAKKAKEKNSLFVSHIHDFVIPGHKNLRIPERSLASMLGLVGGAGQGKTNVMNQFVSSRRSNGGKCFIVDVNGEYASKFARAGDIVLSLHDSRAAKWDLWNEEIPMQDLAESILEMGETSYTTGTSEFFVTASYVILVAMLNASKSADELWNLINLPRDELVSRIKRMPGLAKQMLGATNDGQTAGVLASAVRKLSFLEHLNKRALARESRRDFQEETFSVSNWVNDSQDKRWVFLVATDSTLNQTKTLFRVWITSLTKSLMARSEAEGNERIYLICDELASVGKIPRLSDFLTAVRRKNGRAVLGFQAISQLENIYGKIDTSTIIQGLQNLIVFRCADPAMANLMAERVGKLEVLEHTFSQNLDSKSRQYVPQVSERIRDKWVFSPNTISNLPIGEAILCMSQFSPCLLKFKQVSFPAQCPTAESFEVIPKQSSSYYQGDFEINEGTVGSDKMKFEETINTETEKIESKTKEYREPRDTNVQVEPKQSKKQSHLSLVKRDSAGDLNQET
jgi:hypothetical protein